MKKTILLFWLFLFINTTNAQTFEPFVIIDPPHPMVGDSITIGVAHTLHPGCLDLPGTNQDGLTHLFEFISNDIELYVVNGPIVPICFPFPVIPAIREYYELGVLEEGIYTLDTLIVDEITPLPIPVNGNFFPLVYGPVITFEVISPKVINTNSKVGLLLLFFLFLTMYFHLFYTHIPNKIKP